MFISTHEFQFQFLHFQFFPLFRGEKQESERATIIVILPAWVEPGHPGRQILSLTTSASVTKAIQNTTAALQCCTLTGRDCEGLTVYGVITTDNGYEVSTSIKCVVKECQSSKILFKSLKLAYVSSKYLHHSNL